MGTYLGVELRRLARDPVSVFFIALFPVFLYVAYSVGINLPAGPLSTERVDMYVMIGMAAYGAATAAASISGHAAVERLQGWGRQLSLTPLSDAGYVAVKAGVSIIVAAVPIVGTYAVAFGTGVRAPWHLWVLSGACLLAGAAIWAAYGLCAGLAFRSEAAVTAATGGLVILAFLGNVFVPLGGLALEVARFTPLYGYVMLARFPVTGGRPLLPNGSGGEPLWVPALSLVGWGLVFVLVAWRLVRRGRSRD